MTATIGFSTSDEAMMSRATILSAAVACVAAMAPFTAVADMCFTVLDQGNRTIFQSRTAPVDMTRQIGDTLKQRFPAASIMVFGQNESTCEEIRGVAGARGFGTLAAGAARSGASSAAGPDMSQFFNERRYAPRS